MTRPNSNPRDRILETAGRLFYQQGYQATGINQIIKEAAVAKASFYQHFPSKDMLGLAYLQAYQANRLQTIQAAISQYDNPKDKVLGLFDELESWMVATNFQGCSSINLACEFQSPDHAIRQEAAAIKRMLRQYILELVTEALAHKYVASEIKQRADAIFLLREGAIVETRLLNEVWPIRVARQSVEAMLD